MLKKRLLSGILSFVLAVMLVPCAFASEATSPDVSEDIHVTDYMEFYNNQSTYYSLAKEGHRIIIDVPDNYEELETARLSALAGSSQPDQLIPPTARGTSWPTKTHNVVKDGMYFFEGSTSSYPLYTNYAFVGDYGYVAQFHNRSSTYTLVYRAIYSTPGSLFESGKVTYGKYSSVGLNQTVLDYFSTESTTQRIFFEFSDPCTFEGWIGQDD